MSIVSPATKIYSIQVAAPNGDVYGVPKLHVASLTAAKALARKFARSLFAADACVLGRTEVAEDVHEFASDCGCDLAACRIEIVKESNSPDAVNGYEVVVSEPLAKYATLATA